MVKRNRKAVLIAALLAVSLITGVYAYFIYMTDSITNRFNDANQSTELVEAVYEMRGDTLHKEPYVVNTGTSDVLVRIKITADPEGIYAENVRQAPTNSEKEELIAKGYKYWIEYDKDWTKGSDGYWYYQGVLKPGSDTTPVFWTVNWLDKDSSGKWLDYQDFDIHVYKESVYAEAVTAGGKITSTDNGSYDHEKALKVWEHYDQQAEM